MGDLNFIDFLQYGAIGLSMVLCVLAYRLLSKEQDKTEVREPMLKAIKAYMVFALLTSVLFGAAEFFKETTIIKHGGQSQLSIKTALQHLTANKDSIQYHIRRNNQNRVDIAIDDQSIGTAGSMDLPVKLVKSGNQQWKVNVAGFDLSDARIKATFGFYKSRNTIAERKTCAVGRLYKIKNVSLRFRIDTIYKDKEMVYELSFAEMGEDGQLRFLDRRQKVYYDVDNKNGRIDPSKEYTYLTHPDWKHDYFYRTGVGWPTKDSVKVKGSYREEYNHVDLFNIGVVEVGFN